MELKMARADKRSCLEEKNSTRCGSTAAVLDKGAYSWRIVDTFFNWNNDITFLHQQRANSKQTNLDSTFLLGNLAFEESSQRSGPNTDDNNISFEHTAVL